MNNPDYFLLHHNRGTATDLQPSSASQGTSGDYLRPTPHPQNPRKKRTKLIRIDNRIGENASSSSSVGITVRPKYGKKPDPSAPKITQPCSECGKKFWSWKALFGHMRCHPERQWRGINPLPNFQRWPAAAKISGNVFSEAGMTEKDHDVAVSLLILANSPTIASTSTNHALLESNTVVKNVAAGIDDAVAGCGDMGASGFECSSCKKVFWSHQALGGHMATHKNVKGCFAITRRNDSEEVYHDNMVAIFN